jgi:hypothetical protein
MAVLFVHSNPTSLEPDAIFDGGRDRVTLSLPNGIGDRVETGTVAGAHSGTAKHTPGLGCPPAGVRFRRQRWLELVEGKLDGLPSRTAPGSDRDSTGEIVEGRVGRTALSTVLRTRVPDF